ncbi:MAG: DUF4405 domain-containing protein [Phycisphaerae bacterium]|nr:DUF4405 domain-containing protein [Phycisphaerae bacterium]
MRRNTLNFVVDVVTLLVIFAMVATGLVIRFVLPPGMGGRHGGRGLVLWGLGRHDWGDVHFLASVVLAVLLVVHVALHWSWVCATTHRLLGGKPGGEAAAARHNAYGIGFLLALVVLFGGFTWYARSAVDEVFLEEGIEGEVGASGLESRGAGQAHAEDASHDLVRGSMTLAEVEQATGVPVSTLKAELGLPETASADERLGRLIRQYDITMDQVRAAAMKHMSQRAP